MSAPWGGRAVRPRPAQQSPPESPPPAQARQLRPRCRSAVRNSFRGGGPPFHPRLRIWSGRTVRELGPGRPETADLKRFRRPRAGSGWRTVLSPIVEAGPLGAGRRPPGGAGSSSRPRRTTSCAWRGPMRATPPRAGGRRPKAPHRKRRNAWGVPPLKWPFSRRPALDLGEQAESP